MRKVVNLLKHIIHIQLILPHIGRRQTHSGHCIPPFPTHHLLLSPLYQSMREPLKIKQKLQAKTPYYHQQDKKYYSVFIFSLQ